MSFGTSRGGGSAVNPYHAITLFGQFANVLKPGAVKVNQPGRGTPFGSITPGANLYKDLLSTIEGEFQRQPAIQSIGGTLKDVYARSLQLPERLKSSALGRTDAAQIAAVEASRRAGGLSGDAAAVAADAAARAATTQQTAIAEAEVGALGAQAQLAQSITDTERYMSELQESRFAQQLGTRVGARENLLNLFAGLAGAGTSGVGGATSRSGRQVQYGGSIQDLKK